MNESEVLIEMPGNVNTPDTLELQLSEANKTVLKLQGDLATANTDLSTTKQQLQLKETEIGTLTTKVKDLEDAAKKTAVENEIKGFEAQFKLKPADHEDNVKYVLTLSEEQLTFWRKDVDGRAPVVIQGQEGSGQPGSSTPPATKEATAEELLERNNIQPVKGGK